MLGILALKVHWPPDVLLDLTFSDLIFWLEALAKAEKG